MSECRDLSGEQMTPEQRVIECNAWIQDALREFNCILRVDQIAVIAVDVPEPADDVVPVEE